MIFLDFHVESNNRTSVDLEEDNDNLYIMFLTQKGHYKNEKKISNKAFNRVIYDPC